MNRYQLFGTISIALLLIAAPIKTVGNDPQALKTFSIKDITFTQWATGSDTFHAGTKFSLIDNKDYVRIIKYGLSTGTTLNYDKKTKQLACTFITDEHWASHQDEELSSLFDAYKKLNKE